MFDTSHVTLVFGRSGSGKNTFVYRYLVNLLTPQPANTEPAACVFIFDWKLGPDGLTESSRRLGLPAVTSLAGLEAQIQERIVIFNPHPMFPGTAIVKNPEGKPVYNDDKMACRWFCKWVWEVCHRGPGKKVIFIDELKMFASSQYLPPEIGRIARMGRGVNLGLLTATQFPRDYHIDLRDSVTEWVGFSITEEANLDAVRPYYENVAQFTTLPRGRFVAYNRDSRAELAGKVF